MRYNVITDFVTASTSARPLFLFNSGLICIFSGDEQLFALGSSLLPALRRDVPFPIERSREEELYIDGHFYYAMLEPAYSESGELLCRCELIDRERALRIHDMTDAGAEKLPLYNSMQYHLADLWSCYDMLRKNKGERDDVLYRVEKDINKLFAILKNEHEYLHSIYGEERRTVFDIGKLCCKLDARCNQALAKCGRRFELIKPMEELFVNLSSRRALVALVNVLQNAMLYSPVDTVPIMSAFGEGNYAVVRIVNESIMYSSEDFAASTNPEFNYQRIGSGLPMVRAFTENAGGKLRIECKNGKTILELRLPMVKPDMSGYYYFEASYYPTYTTSVPDFTEVMMQEVVDFFGVKKDN